MNMKKIYLLLAPAAAAAILCGWAGCRKELPYPIDRVKRGVLIDVARVPGTRGVILSGQTTGDYKVRLTVPEHQGDYSSLRHVQLLAVLGDTLGAFASRVAVDSIADFPAEVPIAIADVYGKFGRTTPAKGEALYFTANVLLKNGDLIPGWSVHFGFNNQAFAGWQTDGRAYAYSVKYPVTCPLDLDVFAGAKSMGDGWMGESYPITLTKNSATALTLSGLFANSADCDFLIAVDTFSHTVDIAKQVLVYNTSVWGMPPYTNFALEGAGSIDACGRKMTFTATATVDQGDFGSFTFTIY